MSDIADMADIEVGGAIARGLAAISTAPEVRETGYCLSALCGDEVPPGRRWCDAECRDDWERAKGRQR